MFRLFALTLTVLSMTGKCKGQCTTSLQCQGGVGSRADVCREALVKTVRQDILPEMRRILSESPSCEASGKCGIESMPTDCSEVHSRTSGVHTLYINVRGCAVPYKAYCDMETDGGGWTVIQRRQDGSVNFNRLWADYKNGFGDVDGEFWLGNRIIYDLSNARKTQLRINIMDFTGTKEYAFYGVFYLRGANYMAVGQEYSGTAGDALPFAGFSSSDKGNSACAQARNGGWWYYADCGDTNLNGQYYTLDLHADRTDRKGIRWSTAFGGANNSLAFTEMKIRPSVR